MPRVMETRLLGRSGLHVPVLSFGAGTFGGSGPLFSAWGATDVAGARRIVDICLDAGVTLFDTADVYSDGASEEILGEAVQGRRDRVLLSTVLTKKNSFGSHPDPLTWIAPPGGGCCGLNSTLTPPGGVTRLAEPGAGAIVVISTTVAIAITGRARMTTPFRSLGSSEHPVRHL